MSWRILFWIATCLWAAAYLLALIAGHGDTEEPLLMGSVFLVGSVILDEMHKWRRI